MVCIGVCCAEGLAAVFASALPSTEQAHGVLLRGFLACTADGRADELRSVFCLLHRHAAKPLNPNTLTRSGAQHGRGAGTA